MLLGNLEMTGYEQHETVYESCLDAVDWISKNCMGPDSTCLTIDGEKKSPTSDVSVEMTAAVNSGASVHTSSALLAAGAAIGRCSLYRSVDRNQSVIKDELNCSSLPDQRHICFSGYSWCNVQQSETC